MIISLPELKADLDRYLELVGEEEIIISSDGRNIAQLAPPPRDKLKILESLYGILPPTVDENKIRDERLARHETGL